MLIINAMKITQKGFTLVETLLVIIILAIIGLGGYYVWHTQHSKTLLTTTSTNTNTNSSVPVKVSTINKMSLATGSVTFNLPKDWSTNTTGASSCRIEVASTIQSCLDGATVLPSSLKGDTNNTFSVTISVFNLGSDSNNPELWFENDYQGGGPSTTEPDVTSGSSIDSYPAWYFEQNVTGNQGSGETYQDENYVIISSNKVIYIYSRVKHVNSASNINDDFTKYLPEIKSLVDSIKIS